MFLTNQVAKAKHALKRRKPALSGRCFSTYWSFATAGLKSQALGWARLALKQSLHKTGLPDDGLNGTESFLPH
jgi:hypothetical protein